ncbi:hypothetical protein V496_03359 [Pseudogymnoascus sp. VKM F-4515 (FW-2607)]|nr:hypothetical protein V496_03359 [Pseudogymnoascus sp. VKM F-4515 (FW-2607)]
MGFVESESLESEGDGEAVSMANEKFAVGAGLGNFADMRATLDDRTQGYRGGRYGDEEFTGKASPVNILRIKGREYFIEADGLSDWELQNENIFLKKKWNKGRLTLSPRESEDLRQYIKAVWIRKAGDDAEIYGKMPWNDIPQDQSAELPARPEDATSWDQLPEPAPQIDYEIYRDELRELAAWPGIDPKTNSVIKPGLGSSHSQSRPPSPPQSSPTIHPVDTPQPQSEPTISLSNEEYENIRVRYNFRWQLRKKGLSDEQLKVLKVAMQTEWEERAMPRGKDESMPWHEGHVASHKKALESADLYERHREREWRYEKRKDAFRREWEDMGVGADASKRYALARLIQAAFESVVGTRGITEDMPWTADLQRPESVSRKDEGRERSQPRNMNSPLPDTSSETDYTHLRTEYIAFFCNRVRGEDREETERVAGMFREAWVREVGVRAHDVRMPWDEVLAQMADGDVEQQEEERDMVGGEVVIDVAGLRGRGEGGRKGKGKGKKVEGWTRKRRDLGMECEYQ